MNAYNKNAGINVIIPAYNHHDCIIRCLASILTQTISDKVEVIIVNDCSTHDYSKQINKFKGLLKIREIKLDKNSGPGTARRVGFENSNKEYVTWIDADDTFAGAFALEQLWSALTQNRHLDAVFGTFLEETGNMEIPFVPHTNDCVWMFGKMYRREFLDHYNIKMNDTRSNEDMGFNQLCIACSDNISFLDSVVYYWHSTEESITRKADNDYQFKGLKGYIENHIWAQEECVKRNIHLKESRIVALVDAFIMIYAYYLEVLQTRPVYQQDECFTWCKQFYDKCIKPMKSSITDELFNTRFCLLNSSLNQEGGVLFSVIPLITIKDFIEKLDNEGEDING